MPDQGQVLYQMIQQRAGGVSRGYLAGIWATDWKDLPRDRQDMWRLVAEDFMQSLAPPQPIIKNDPDYRA